MKARRNKSKRRVTGIRNTCLPKATRKNVFATDEWKNYDYQKAMKEDIELSDVFSEINNLNSQEILDAARQEKNREKRDLLYDIFNYLLKEDQKRVIAGGEFII